MVASDFELLYTRFEARLKELINIFSIINKLDLLGNPFFKVKDSLLNYKTIV